MAPTVSSMGTFGIDAMLVVEVDVVDAEAVQRRRRSLPHVLRAAVDARGRLPSCLAHVAELGGEHDLVAAAADRLADQLLVGEGAVHIGGVEKIDAEIERAMDRGDRLVVVAAAIELGHAHAAESQRGNGEAGGAEGSLWDRDHESEPGLGW